MAVKLNISIVLFLLIVNSLLNGIESEQYDIWGDLRRTQIVIGSAKTKYAFPFIKRTVEISYPDVSI